jgi:hypothetical protein
MDEIAGSDSDGDRRDGAGRPSEAPIRKWQLSARDSRAIPEPFVGPKRNEISCKASAGLSRVNHLQYVAIVECQFGLGDHETALLGHISPSDARHVMG